MINLLLFGPPGSGKGTQSKKLVEKYNLTHVSVGDLLRAHISDGTDLGKQAAIYINEGNLVPNRLMIGLLEEQISANKNGHGFVLDGFPRSIGQAEMLEKKMLLYDIQISAVIFLEVPEKISLQRIRTRATRSARVDDQDETKVARRMAIYARETLPVTDYFAAQNRLHTVDGVGEIDTVFERISTIVDQL